MKVVLTLLTPLGLPGVGGAHFENCCTEITSSILFFIGLLIFGLLDYYYSMFILYFLSQFFYIFYFLPFVFIP